jgi:hypothetical protein
MASQKFKKNSHHWHDDDDDDDDDAVAPGIWAHPVPQLLSHSSHLLRLESSAEAETSSGSITNKTTCLVLLVHKLE